MKAEWLTRTGASKLILFFAGWGMDPRPFGRIAARESDVLMFYNYCEDEFPAFAAESCGDYDHVSLVAWSLGVPVAERVCRQQSLEPCCSLAVNGTPCPVEDRYGIPVSLFDSTVKALSEESLLRFYRRMCKQPSLLEQFLENVPRRTIQELGLELSVLRNVSSCDQSVFHRALISTHDRIVPAENQFRCWQKLGVPTGEIPGPHFPFYDYASWEDLIGTGTSTR